MCGIAGVIAPASVDVATVTPHVASVVAHQHHRGPDNATVATVLQGAATAVFGHNRLSIIDLSTAANQPMWDVERRYCLTYNGEIYNYVELRADLVAAGHRFETASDSEVLIEAVKAWGIDGALERCNGMFAFGLLDTRDAVLWLARDRFGKKPLHVRRLGDALAFASSAQALARCHPAAEPDPRYAAQGLRYLVYEDGSDASPYRSVDTLPGGCLMEVRLDRGRVTATRRRYYDLAERVAATADEVGGWSRPQAADAVLSMLTDAVRLRLRADVPLGVSLSGGLDSSSVTALVAARHDRVMGITYGDPDDPGSEAPLAALLARQAGADARFTGAAGANVVAALLPTLAAQEAPFPTASIVAQHLVFAEAKRLGLKVMLGGQGGDEVFMGYRKFFLFALRRAVHERRAGDALTLACGMVPLMAAEARNARSYWWAARRRYLGRGATAAALSLPEPLDPGLAGSAGDARWAHQADDVLRFSLPTLLRYEDRNSMGSSIESRLPFLDYRLVELGLALPTNVKIHRGYGKWVLREAVDRLVPDEIRLARYKRGFDVSFAGWMASGLGTALRSELHERRAAVQPHLATGATIDGDFSDEHLLHDRGRFGEAVTALWLADVPS